MVIELWGDLGLCTSRYVRLSWWGNIIHLFGSPPQKNVCKLSCGKPDL